MEIINIIYSKQPLLILVFGFLGLIIGSFLNVVIYRLPIMLKNDYRKSCIDYFMEEQREQNVDFNVASPRSHCPICKKMILWWQNIPLISFLILKGKCKHCESKIPWRYPLVEAITAAATILVALHFGAQHTKTLSVLILTWGLIAALFIDFEHQLLPDIITLPLIWLGLLVNTNYVFTSPQNAILGAITGYLFLWVVAKIFKMIRKIDGMGNGDFKLLAVFGAWLGWHMLPFIIFTASLLGTIVGFSWIISKKYILTRPLPFGPYIAFTGWLAFFWGTKILKWYLVLH